MYDEHCTSGRTQQPQTRVPAARAVPDVSVDPQNIPLITGFHNQQYAGQRPTQPVVASAIQHDEQKPSGHAVHAAADNAVCSATAGPLSNAGPHGTKEDTEIQGTGDSGPGPPQDPNQAAHPVQAAVPAHDEKPAQTAAYEDTDIEAYGDLSQYHPIRRFCIRVCTNADFELLVMAAILANCVTLSLYRPVEPDDSDFNTKLFWADLGLNVFYTIEMFLRIVCLGPPWVISYLRKPWNVFDLLMVIVGYTAFIPSDLTGGNTSAIRALRAVRALRPLRTITRFESLRAVVVCFVEVGHDSEFCFGMIISSLKSEFPVLHSESSCTQYVHQLLGRNVIHFPVYYALGL